MSAPGTTPGRWRVSTSPITKARGIDIIAGYDRIVASVPVLPDYMSGRTHAEDAHLIAAAPDLFEALAAIMSERWSPGGRSEEASDLARAALAKARGETK